MLSLDGLGRLAAELADLEVALADVGKRATEVILEEGRKDTGGDLILSNFARGRVKLTVETNINGSSLTLTAVPPGPWMLLEAGSHKSGWWEPRRSGRKKIAFADGNVRNYVRHGHVRARNTFTRARQRIEVEAPKWFDAWVTEQIRRAA
jgi:hypothetical protein